MREFDLNGIRLAEFQGKIFEQSTTLSCSTAIFLRRFFNSSYLKNMDKNESYLLSLCPIDAFNEIEQEFGQINYGNNKEDKEILFWIGYLYRYISYTRNIKTSTLYKLINYKDLIPLYCAFHTQSPEWCTQSLFEKYHIENEFLDRNKKLRILLEKQPK